MIDTSVLIAGLIPDHEFHDQARPHVLAAPSPSDHVDAVADAARSGAGGGVHDRVIARTCASASIGLVTLDRRQAAMARELGGLDVTLLL